MMAWVYFIQHGGSAGAIKIGTTAGNPYTRLRTLQTGAPEALRLLCAVPGDARLERELHGRFAALRVRTDGEWFAATPDLLAFIEGARVARQEEQPVDEEEDDLFGLSDDQVLAIIGATIGYVANLDFARASVAMARGGTAEAVETLRRLAGLADQVKACSGTGFMARGSEWAELGYIAEQAETELDALAHDEAEVH